MMESFTLAPSEPHAAAFPDSVATREPHSVLNGDRLRADRGVRPMPPAKARGSRDGSPTRLRIGLVGAGLVGQASHAPILWDGRARFEFVAVADASPTVRRAVADRYGVPNACARLEDALALGLDAVVIAVPDPAHRNAVVTALHAGVHVLCEKPLAVSLAECDEILVARKGHVVQCGYMKLSDPAVRPL